MEGMFRKLFGVNQWAVHQFDFVFEQNQPLVNVEQ